MAYNRTTQTAVRTSRRVRLAKATSGIALATGLALGASGTAHAQAFEGNPTVVSGGVNIVRSPGIDEIQVDTDQAVINWTTNDTALTGTPINFLPGGRTAFFRNNPSAQNLFTVLNRIIPAGTSRSVQLNGSIISQLQTASGLVPGGNVWFYSPGGIVVNSTAVIDVGGLLLTSSDPVRDGAGNFINGAGAFTLGPSAAASSVIVQAGAQIRATPENSYVAMVAPTVLQGGNVNVNGSALYVGAEAATITFGGNGLFDIQVTTGTNGTGGVAVGHNGVTTGPASSGAGDNHRIYMVAVPKNNAITLALSGGSLGFDVAGAANVSGNSIILSSGYNVFGDSIDDSAPVNPAQGASVSLQNANVTSALRGGAATNFRGDASANNTLSFAGQVDVFGRQQAIFLASGANSAINFAGDAFISANARTNVVGANTQAGLAQVSAFNGGTVNVGGNLSLSADATGGDNFGAGTVGSGTGGIVALSPQGGGRIVIGGDVFMSADGFAGNGSTATGSNFGRGGQVIVTALTLANSELLINGDLLASASGFGSDDFGAGTGGAGFGGTITVRGGNVTGTAGTNNTISILGTATLAANGFGGNSDFGIGGAGTGGTAIFGGATGGGASVTGNLLLTALGIGGATTAATGTGGLGTGGNTQFGVFSAGGSAAAGGDVVLQSIANGGFAGTAGGNGGNAQGGTAQIVINGAGGTISVAGLSTVESLAVAGSGTIGGNAIGGTSLVNTITSGTMTLNNGVNIGAGGIGGEAGFSGIGRSGNGTGGLAQMVAFAGGNINVTGTVDVNANGIVFTSEADGVDGGNGTGGNASISQNTGGRITITGDAAVRAFGVGDRNTGGGDGIAGTGTGGDARIAVNDLNITITGNAAVDASGFGGDNLGGLRGGTGTGGLANLGAGAGTLSIGGDGLARADGVGGSSFLSGSGGDGVGGRAVIGSIPGGIIQIAGVADASAQGFGGNAAGAGSTGGLGDGGEAQLFAENTGSVTVGGATLLNASAFGGSASGGANSGAATGGLVSLLSFGTGQVTLNQDAFFSAQALSGNVDDGAGNAAAATGGTVNLIAIDAGGGITVNGNLLADAIAGAGSAVTGTIGNALGGTVELQAASGLFTVTGGVSLDATAFGGNSTLTGNGGNATGGRTAVVIGGIGGGTVNIGSALTMTSNAFGGSAQTGNGGSGTGGLSEAGTISRIGAFTFGGTTSMSANGFGGDALLAGNGGNGIGGESRLGANDTPMTGRDLIITASGRGGNGALGGRGGDAVGGFSLLNASFGNVIGLLDFDNVFMFAEAVGGAGGAGATGATGGLGGAGGNATGGQVNAFASARNGQLDIGNLQVTINGFGGAGGAGGTGTAGAGGTGGAGGSGTGGFTQLGTISSTILNGVNPTPTGFMRMANAFVDSSGVGGTGGDGGVGTTLNGNGGNGGLGDAGDLFLGARGSLVQSDALTLLANGFGGNGGNGAVRGNGGNGIGGTIGVESTEQFSAPNNRGTLIVGDLLAIAQGTGGAGATGGLSLYETGSFFRAVNGDVTANSIVYNITGDAAEPTGIIEDYVRISDGTVNAGTSFTFATGNALSVLVNNGALNADGVGLSAGTFVADTVIAPTNLGNITTNGLGLFSNNDLVISANLNTTQDIAISVPGTVTLGNINGGGVIGITASNLTLGNLVSGNHINLTSTSGAITAGSLTASNFIAMTAANGLTLGIAQASSGYIDLLVLSGDMNIGSLSAGSYIALETDAGNIVLGDTQSGQETEIDAVGAIQFGNANAGLNFLATSTGNITGGNVTSLGALSETTYSVGLLSSGGSIAVGNLSGPRNIGFLSPGTISAGSITGGENIVVLGLGNIQFAGPVTGGTGATNFFYVGSAGMAALLGPDFNPAPLFTATPVRTGGSLTVNGPIQAGNVLAGVGTAFSTTGAITANGGRVGITANSIATQAINSTLATVLNATNGAIAANAITAGGAITMASTGGGLTFGALTSGANTQLSATGSVIGGDITSGSSIGTVVGGNLTLGNLRTTGPGVATSGFGISMGANGTITTGNIDSFGSVVFGLDDGQGIVANALSITSGAITAGGGVLLRSTEGLTTGAISSTADIRVRGGNVTLGALNANTAVLAAATTGSLSTGNITAGTSALLLAGQSVNTGSITTGATGITLVTNSSAISSTGLVSIIDLNALMAGTPSPIGGSVSFGGPVTTGTLQSASTGGFSASGAIAAGSRITINTNGTAVFGGLAAAPTITVASGDIAFSQNGGLGNASTGTLTLTANRSGPVILGGSGDSQSQQGSYTLDGSEISRIRAQSIVINAPNVSSSSSAGVEIRALTMNGSAAASGVNLNGAEGSLTINTGGTIRVNGNAIFNSMAPTNRVALNAGRVEINADTGGIFLNGSSPGGVLSITANNIHIAGAELLGRLAENVNFTGRDTALGVPIATSRPDGVIQASRLQFNVGSTLLIQNTGTSLLNAGFFGRVGSIEIVPRSSQGSSSGIDMVIYGQLLDTGDIVRSGNSVRDLIFPTSTSPGQDGPATITGFTATSSVNGCLLNAVSCGSGGITTQAPTAVVHAGPPPPQAAEERQAEREQEEAEAAAEEAARGEAAPRRPIMPPVTIVNTRRLGVEPIIDEPVTSGGNPNLQLDQPLTEIVPEIAPDTGGQP